MNVSGTLEKSLRKNPVISAILDQASSLDLPNWYLGAGCVAQTVWNELHGFELTAHIKDYDLVYFDESDLTLESEDLHLREAQELFHSFDAKVELKNEARVHLWYPERFGYSINPYKSVEDAITSWPTTATSIGVKLDRKGRFTVFAPFGTQDIYDMVVRPNRKQITKAIYLDKVRRYSRFWPHLTVVPWD